MCEQNILDEITELTSKFGGSLPDVALPCVWNPTISYNADHHLVELPDANDFNPDDHAVTPVTNAIAQEAMGLFNMANDVLIKMLQGYFNLIQLEI